MLLLHTLSASLLVFAPLVSASHPMIMSFNVSEFKVAYDDIGIVPEVVAGIDPSCSFYFGYEESDGDKALMMPGHTISLFEAQQMPFEFSVEGLTNVTNATSLTRYLIYITKEMGWRMRWETKYCFQEEMMHNLSSPDVAAGHIVQPILTNLDNERQADVDAPDRSDPTSRNLRHYFGGNFTVDGTSELLDTAQKLVNSSMPFTEFVNPDPQIGTGVHRFLSAIYIQPDRFSTEGFETTGMDRARTNWNLSEWRTQLGLGPAIGATVWMVNTTDAGTLNAAPGLSVSPWRITSGLSAALLGAFALL
ncbi:hypothetical protein MKZ38_002388 [Zalerion maritima]|uniref:Uncharacterized protein n=1 Tax=Zalerion maritima TaxID=339359 RepID=A0AAD5RQ07_9PEZI|nr:hypothetical protein MKZ38_002388 [Zalerion maritima]